MWLRIGLILVLLLSGCAIRNTPPSPSVECGAGHTFYVLGHGWHTGIAVPRDDLISLLPTLSKDFPQGKFIEIGWGDEEFYQAQTATIWTTLGAILWPTSTVLHVAAFSGAPGEYFRDSEVIEITVLEAGYRRLLQYIVDTFARTPDKELKRLGPGIYGHSWFYRAVGSYSTFNTCNTWVAEAIRTSSFPMSNPKALTAEGVMEQLRGEPSSSTDCVRADRQGP